MMVTLSADAQGHLDRYLKQVKAALRAHPSVDACEIERDVLGHIDAELADQPQPISATSLGEVLERLGAPDAWVPPDSRARTAVGRWTLYLALGSTPVLLAAGTILLLGGPMFWPLDTAMVIASFLLARVSLELLADRDEPAGAWRWLIYPPLLLVYVVFAVVVLAWPAAPVVLASENAPDRWLSMPLWVAVASAAALAVGVWWLFLGFVAARFPDAVRAAFRPFADRFEPHHARKVVVGGALLITFAAAAIGVTIAGGSTASAASAQAAVPQASKPLEPIGAIVDAFRSHRLVALGEGMHGNEQGHAFRAALVRDLRFAGTVNDIVVRAATRATRR
jgi:hypothetical protein